MSLPLTAVIAELKQTPKSAVPILLTLHAEIDSLSTISKVDLKHLTSRTIGLLKKHEPHSIWCGVNIINVLIDSSVVLNGEGSLFFLSLLKVWTSPEAKGELITSSIVECLNKLCKNIRGKPTLTREVLTPNLGPLLSAYLERMLEYPELIVPSLQILILEHPTTSRPYGNKIKTKLLEFISQETFMWFPQKLRSSIASLLASLTVIEKEGPEKFWAQDVNRIISNLSSTLNIYSNFLSISEDDDTNRVLKELGEIDSTEIFSPLHIDINEPTSILCISTRIALLLELFKGYLFLPTSFAVSIPIGQVIAILDLAFSINTKYVPFKREMRDVAAREYVDISLLRTHQSALEILAMLPAQFSSSLIPHLVNIFASLELLIFLQKNHIDRGKVLKYESFSCAIVSTTTRFLALTAYVKDFSLLSRIVDLALILVEPRAATSIDTSTKSMATNHSKSAKKNARKGGSSGIADLLSAEHLFKRNVPAATRSIALEFFAAVIKKSPVASTQYNKLIKFIVTEAVQLRDKSKYASISKDINDLLVAALLHPGANSASIYSISSSITSSALLSLVQNPRFPPLPTKVKNVVISEELESEDEIVEPQNKKQKLVNVETRFEVSEPVVSVDTVVSEVPAHMIFKEVKEEVGTVKETIGKVVEKIELDEIEVQAEDSAPACVASQAEDDDDSDDGSEIEIPELHMDSDSEGET